MTDVVDADTRSRMMSGIRHKNTKPEKQVRSLLHRQGLRFRLHGDLPGQPDLVFPKYRAVVFVHGCYWHRHRGCRYAATPATNKGFWQAKFKANVERDQRACAELRRMGWHPFIVWECSISPATMHELATSIREYIRHAETE